MPVWSACYTVLEDTTHPVSEVSLCLYGLGVIQCWRILLILSLRSHCASMVCMLYSVGGYYSSCL